MYADRDLAADFLNVLLMICIYIMLLYGKRTGDISYLLDLTQTRCQGTAICPAGLSQKPLDISPSIFAPSVVYQDTRISETTYLQTKFIVIL